MKMTKKELEELQAGNTPSGKVSLPTVDEPTTKRVRNIPIEAIENKVRVAGKYPFKSWYNSLPEEGKVFTKESMTQPDQTMSIEQLLQRHVRGLPLQGKTPVFMGDDPNQLGLTEEEFQKMEITDRMEYVETQRALVEEMRKDLMEKEKKTREEYAEFVKFRDKELFTKNLKSDLGLDKEVSNEKGNKNP